MTPAPTHPAPAPDGHDGPAGRLSLAPGVDVPAAAVAFSYSRSSGPGGQNVNKLSTRAELRLSLADLPLRPGALARLAAMAGSRVTADGQLIIVSQSERSQQGNRADCLEKLRELLVRAIPEPKVRRATKPTRGSKMRRLEGKKIRSGIKRGRSGGGED